MSLHIVPGCDPDRLTEAMRHTLGLGQPSTNGTGHNPAACWRRRADELADWTIPRKVNRYDVSGGYYLDADGEIQPVTSHDELTRQRIIRHYRAKSVGDVLGLHTTVRVVLEKDIEPCLSLWGATDIDQHGELDFSQANLAAALAWYDKLVSLGFRPLLTDSNGKGGYHLRVMFDEPMLTPQVRQLFRWLVQDWQERGLDGEPEVFPKQNEITLGGNGSCGNWLRLPGRHPKREHWSRVWDGSQWLEGDEAIDFILGLTGDPARLIPNEAFAFEPEAIAADRRADPASPRPLTTCGSPRKPWDTWDRASRRRMGATIWTTIFRG